MRRYTWWLLAAGPAAIVLLTPLELGSGKYGVVAAVLLGLATVLVLAQHVRHLRFAMRSGNRRVHWLEHGVTFAASLAVLAYVSYTGDNPTAWSLLPAVVIAHVAATTPRGVRWISVGVGTALTLVANGAFRADYQLHEALVPVFFIATFVFAELTQLWFWHLALELDQARHAAQALAVAEERLRFAADLHDIQGHHLQAIALKGELAERLVGRDDDAARKQASEIAELARTALRETRDVVQGYRRASLGTEIANAVGIFEAAGIRSTIEGDAGDVPQPLQPLFGALVREGTTNVLRHSAAKRCEVVISVLGDEVRVRLRNDGARRGDPTETGSGLAGLRERFATVGGRVDAGAYDPDGFELAGRAEVPR
jgi:two-component system sensor histidine kinase DesK